MFDYHLGFILLFSHPSIASRTRALRWFARVNLVRAYVLFTIGQSPSSARRWPLGQRRRAALAAPLARLSLKTYERSEYVSGGVAARTRRRSRRPARSAVREATSGRRYEQGLKRGRLAGRAKRPCAVLKKQRRRRSGYSGTEYPISSAAGRPASGRDERDLRSRRTCYTHAFGAPRSAAAPRQATACLCLRSKQD